MESKKVNVFAMIMIVVMCAFSIFIGLKNNNGEDGKDGLSSYELAVKEGTFSGSLTEYLSSLNGEDGRDVSVEDLYNAYKRETNSDISLVDFLTTYYPDGIYSSTEKRTQSEIATNIALRSTVDICYSYYMNTQVQQLTELSDGYYAITTTSSCPVGVSAGSGVIYKMTSDVAYIITNYHVVYADNYSNSSDYSVYYDSTNQKYVTAKIDSSKITKKLVNMGLFGGYSYYDCVSKTDVEYAPLYTHFLDSYNVYLYGYQDEEHALTATFVGGSADNDIAVLKIEKSASNENSLIFSGNYTAVTLGDSTKLVVGEDAIAVGNPLIADTSKVNTDELKTPAEYVAGFKKSYVDALCLTATNGVVSSVSEVQPFSSLIGSGTVDMRLIRVSSAINAGNSGGGLYDIDGRLIGIVNGKIASSDYDNVGYAIPINVASRIADQVIAQCDGDNTKVTIKVLTNASFGIETKTSNNKTYDKTNQEWTNENKVVVSSVSALGEFSKKGLGKDVVINSIKINDTTYTLHDSYDFCDYLLIASFKDNVKVVLNITSLTETKDYEFNFSTTSFVEF